MLSTRQQTRSMHFMCRQEIVSNTAQLLGQTGVLPDRKDGLCLSYSSPDLCQSNRKGYTWYGFIYLAGQTRRSPDSSP